MSLTHARACARCNFPLEKAQIICPECGAVWTPPDPEEMRLRGRLKYAVAGGVALVVLTVVLGSSGLWYQPLLSVLPTTLAGMVKSYGVLVICGVALVSIAGILRYVRPQVPSHKEREARGAARGAGFGRTKASTRTPLP